MVLIEDKLTPEMMPPKRARKSRSQASLNLPDLQLRIWRQGVVPATQEELAKLENPWDNAKADFGSLFTQAHNRFLSNYPVDYRPGSVGYIVVSFP